MDEPDLSLGRAIERERLIDAPDSGGIPDAGTTRPAREGATRFSHEREATRVIRLICEACGSLFYSAAAASMVERGERCAVCGGALILANEEPDPGEGVAVGAGRNGGHGAASRTASGRLERH